MDWGDLRYFLAVSRAGTLAAAARELGVEHTTVGRRIAALESALGVRLFTRGPAGFSLTAAGEAILPNVEAIAQQVEALSRRVDNEDARVAGSVRLTIPESAAAYFMRRLEEFRERHPELVIVILSDNRALDLRRGEADVAVRLRGVTDPDLVVRKAGTVGWSLYASPEYVARKGPLASATDFRGHDLLAFDTSLSEIVGAQWLRLHGADANIVLRGNSIAAVASAAAAGLGLAPLPCFVAEDCGLVRLRPELIGAREIILAVHPDLTRVARVRAVLDYLLELFERDKAMWSGVG